MACQLASRVYARPQKELQEHGRYIFGGLACSIDKNGNQKTRTRNFTGLLTVSIKRLNIGGPSLEGSWEHAHLGITAHKKMIIRI